MYLTCSPARVCQQIPKRCKASFAGMAYLNALELLLGPDTMPRM
jgi:hypothetical protein